MNGASPWHLYLLRSLRRKHNHGPGKSCRTLQRTWLEPFMTFLCSAPLVGHGRPKPAHLLLLSDWLAAGSKVGTVQSWRAQCKVMSPAPSSADPRSFRDGPDEPASQQSWRMEVVGSHQKRLHPDTRVFQLFRKSLRCLGLISLSTRGAKSVTGLL